MGVDAVTRSEFIRLLREIEGAYPVTEWRVRGIRVWPLLRLSLYSATFRSGSPEHGLGAAWPRRVWNLAAAGGAWSAASIRDWSRNRFPGSPADAVFVTYSAGRRPLVRGRRYDPMSGPCVALLAQLEQRCEVWEISPFGDYNTPRHTPSFLLQPTLIRLRLRCELAPLGDDRVALDGFPDLTARVRSVGLRFPYADLRRLRRDVLYLDRLADRYAAWLRRARPRIGFVTDTGIAQQAFVLACRRLGITTVEMQHGVQGDLHPSYGSWFRVPSEGYETRARLFWNHDRDSALAINRWASCCPEGHLAVWGGDPWREMWMDPGNELVAATDADVRARLRAAGGERHVLVTLSSQGEVMPPPALELVRRPPDGVRVWLRMHPADQRRRRAEILRVLGPGGLGPEHLAFATETPLPALLRRMDAHVTVGLSTVIAQAARMGVPSIACASEAADFYPSELAQGMLEIATTPADVREALLRLLARGRGPVSTEPPRALDTMRRLVRGEPQESVG